MLNDLNQIFKLFKHQNDMSLMILTDNFDTTCVRVDTNKKKLSLPLFGSFDSCSHIVRSSTYISSLTSPYTSFVECWTYYSLDAGFVSRSKMALAVIIKM